MKRSWALGAAGALLFFAGSAPAHELQEGTARVTLRDDHLSVDAQLDVASLVARASGAASLAELAAADEGELAARVALARDMVATETVLAADGARVDLAVVAFPSPAEVRALSGWAAAPGAHPELRPVRLDAVRAVPGAGKVSLALPRAAGPVLVSFVQPAAQMTAPGGVAAFTVLAAPAERPSAVEQPSTRRWASALAVVLAVAGLAVNVVMRRGTMVVSRGRV